MNRPTEKRTAPFMPVINEGCVARDIHMARMLQGCYQGELVAIAAYLCRSRQAEHCDRALSELFDELAHEEIAHFRLVGELIAALGGVPAVQAEVCIKPVCVPREKLAAVLVQRSLRQLRSMTDAYQTAMGQTGDRVVRSLLSGLTANLHRQTEILKKQLIDATNQTWQD